MGMWQMNKLHGVNHTVHRTDMPIFDHVPVCITDEILSFVAKRNRYLQNCLMGHFYAKEVRRVRCLTFVESMAMAAVPYKSVLLIGVDLALSLYSYGGNT